MEMTRYRREWKKKTRHVVPIPLSGIRG
jgi:hypothetical protein